MEQRTLAKQLALTLVKAIIARKQQQHIVPSQAIDLEIHHLLNSTLDDLVAEGLLARYETLNYIAYASP